MSIASYIVSHKEFFAGVGLFIASEVKGWNKGGALAQALADLAIKLLQPIATPAPAVASPAPAPAAQ